MSQNIWDVLIIGGGPGGLAAGIYCGRSKLKTLLLEKGALGGQIIATEHLENYPGFGRGSKGSEVASSMAEHAMEFGLVIEKDEAVKLEQDNFLKVVHTRGGNTYRGKTVILAMGARPRPLGVKGEKELLGKGVSYCATCDADFFEELDVVVVGNGDQAIEEAMYLTKFANRVTIIIRRGLKEIGGNKASAEKAMGNPKISWIVDSSVESIEGDGMVESVTVRNLKSGDVSRIDANGVFVFIGTEPNTAFLSGTIKLDDHGWILTDEKMVTSMEGVYAVGDVRKKNLRQVVTAVSDGAVAAVSCERHLEEDNAFRERVLEAEQPVLVVFWAPEVKESAVVLARVERLADSTHIDVVNIDLYKKPTIALRYDITQNPTVLLFKQGRVVQSWAGSILFEDLKNRINTEKGA